MTDESIFAGALAIRNPSARAAYLDRACAGQPALRREVEELLAAHADDNPLDRPLADVGHTGPYEPGIPGANAPGSPCVGDRVGSYRLMEQIGEGGFGLVFVADQQEPVRRKVALKVIKPGMDTRDVVGRFEAERQALALMDHPNIAKVLDAGSTPTGRPYFVMELVRGVPITDYCDQHKLPPRDRLALFVQVCHAVQHAHQKGIIHRDMKPSNLLLSPAGRLSVNDFGLARLLEQPGMTMTGEFVGTPAYTSPEQIASGRIPLDHRTDIYSLGATLYELLTLQPPFTGKQRDLVLAQIVQKEPVPPRRVNKKVPVDLETICLKCLEKDPDRRYASAGALAEDLRRYVNRFAISARRAGPVRRLVKWVRRRPALAATLAAACLLALVAAFFAYRGHLAEQRLLAEKQEQEQLLAAEKRQSALEKALLVAMSGDLDAAERAIQEAERQGVSTGQVRLLRGEVAYYRGHVNEAIQHLEQAVQLLPVEQSAGARGLLAVAYVYAGRIEEASRVQRELEPIDPISVEDFLFKGAAMSQWSPYHACARRSDTPRSRRTGSRSLAMSR